MTDVAAAATAIATAITASITPSTGAPTVQLTPFSGSPTEDFRVFKEQIQSSIALAQVPDVGKVDYLKLHLTGGALIYFLELPPGDKNTLDNALGALERRYFSANQLELYKLKFQERKFDESKETPEDYLTDLTKLANIAFANATGTDRSGERTRRIRDAFISGMPTQIRLKLLMRPDTDTVATLCSQVSKRLVLKSILPDGESSTAFNVVDNVQTDTLTKVLNSVVEAQRDISKTQKQIGQQMSRMDKSMQFNSRSNYPRTRIRDRGQGRYSQNWTQRNPNWNYRGHLQNKTYSFQNNNWAPRGGFNNQRAFRPRFSAIICRICGQPGHMQRDCLARQPAQRGGNIPFATFSNQKN